MNQHHHQRRRPPPDGNRPHHSRPPPPDRSVDRTNTNRRLPLPPPPPPPPPPHPSNQPSQQHHHQPPPPTFSRTPDEIPPHYRRTLLLTHIPPHLTYRDLRHHFTHRHHAAVEFCTVDRDAAEAYVKFRERGDVLRIWEGGDAGLDGGGNGEGSLVEAGVKLKAIHWTNRVERGAGRREGGGGRTGEKKRSWDGRRRMQEEEEEAYGRSGRGSQQPDQREKYGPSRTGGGTSSNKTSRYSNDYYATQTNHSQYSYSEEYNTQQEEASNVKSHLHSSAPSHPSVRGQTYVPANRPAPKSDPTGLLRHSTPQDNGHPALDEPTATVNDNETPKPSSQIQIHSSQTSSSTQQQEPQQQPQQPQQQQPPQKPLAWHRNTPTQLSTQISTLQQKLSLLQKQETTLQKQLTLQKKILAVFQSKNHSKDDQTKKLKEILTLQTRVMELKKERMGGIQELEALREKKKKKRSMMNSPQDLRLGGKNVASWGGGGGGSRKSLDRRTTVLRVEGWNGDGVPKWEESLQESIKEHFAAFGSVVSVSMEGTESDETTSRVAFVKFANRVDAERAKASDAKFNEMTLTCTWHNPPPSSAPPSTRDTSENRQDETNTNGDAIETNNIGGDHDTYNDVYDDAYEEEEGAPFTEEGNDGGAEYYEEDDEYMVDYD